MRRFDDNPSRLVSRSVVLIVNCRLPGGPRVAVGSAAVFEEVDSVACLNCQRQLLAAGLLTVVAPASCSPSPPGRGLEWKLCHVSLSSLTLIPKLKTASIKNENTCRFFVSRSNVSLVTLRRSHEFAWRMTLSPVSECYPSQFAGVSYKSTSPFGAARRAGSVPDPTPVVLAADSQSRKYSFSSTNFVT